MKYIIQTLGMERLKQPGLLTYGIQKRSYNRPAFIAKFIEKCLPKCVFLFPGMRVKQHKICKILVPLGSTQVDCGLWAMPSCVYSCELFRVIHK